MGDGADDARDIEEMQEYSEDRYAIFAVTRRGRWCLAETSLDGIGVTLRTLHDEGQTTGDGVRVGILDQIERVWLVNPWKGRGFHHV